MATIDTYDRITLDMLNEKSVSVLRQTYTKINDVETQVGEDWRVAFANSVTGRTEIANFLGEDSDQYKAVMQIWGSSAIIIEPTISDTDNIPEEYSEVYADII